MCILKPELEEEVVEVEALTRVEVEEKVL